MYFCKNCGEAYVSDNAIMCVKCGSARGTGYNYCQECGKPVPPNAFACPNCGVGLATGQMTRPMPIPNQKSKVVAGLLGIFLGAFGVHNFYLGYTTKGIIQLVGTIISYLLACFVVGLFTAAGIAIWGFVEGILIFSGNISVDGYGNPIGE